jgi:SAM-dependent methyltransferase
MQSSRSIGTKPVSYEWCFDEHESGTLGSAQVIVPMVMKLVHPKSVVDIGCGRGTWLQVFKENGVSRICGIDSPGTDSSKLHIDIDSFTAADINEQFDISERFDLAVCLEVIEHLTPRAGRNLVRVLCNVSPLVLFSAALPGQRGVGHINEQWPSYWLEIFQKHGFQRIDPFRSFLFNDGRVSWWYRQGIYLYASYKAIEENHALQRLAEETSEVQLDIVNHNILRRFTTFSGLVKELFPAFLRALKQRV